MRIAVRTLALVITVAGLTGCRLLTASPPALGANAVTDAASSGEAGGEVSPAASIYEFYGPDLVLCDSPGVQPPAAPAVTCEAAIRVAWDALLATLPERVVDRPWIDHEEFHYGEFCPADGKCGVPRLDIGYVEYFFAPHQDPPGLWVRVAEQDGAVVVVGELEPLPSS